MTAYRAAVIFLDMDTTQANELLARLGRNELCRRAAVSKMCRGPLSNGKCLPLRYRVAERALTLLGNI